MLKKIVCGRIVAWMLTLAMIVTLTPAALFMQTEKASAATMPQNPRVTSYESTWDCIWFGDYWQSSSSRKEPIKWRVLSVNGGEALLLSDRILDVRTYNNSYSSITWESSNMRSWLNSTFLNDAFSSAEQNNIIRKTVVNYNNPSYGTYGGASTSDKIFLPSLDEVKYGAYGFQNSNYTSNTRLAKLTNVSADKLNAGRYYANNAMPIVEENDESEDGVIINEEDCSNVGINIDTNEEECSKDGNEYYWCAGDSCTWWLRSPGESNYYAACVNYYGYVSNYGEDIHYRIYGVRPAIYVNLSASNLWANAGTVSSNGSVYEIAAPASRDISDYSITLSNSTYTYDGKAKKPSVRISGLTKDVDYTVTYSNHKNAGRAKVTIKGIGYYTGTAVKYFRINPQDISGTSAYIKTSSYTYDGKTKRPAASLNDDSLVKGTDYTVTYSNNKNVGKARVKFTGTGNYTGVKVKYFKINPRGVKLRSVSRGKAYIKPVWYKQDKKMSTSRISGYQLRYSRSSTMKNAKTVKVKGYATTSKYIKNLTRNKKYYVQVRTYKVVDGVTYYSSWSSKKYATTK